MKCDPLSTAGFRECQNICGFEHLGAGQQASRVPYVLVCGRLNLVLITRMEKFITCGLVRELRRIVGNGTCLGPARQAIFKQVGDVHQDISCAEC
jgi:hypothetical protein